MAQVHETSPVPSGTQIWQKKEMRSNASDQQRRVASWIVQIQALERRLDYIGSKKRLIGMQSRIGRLRGMLSNHPLGQSIANEQGISW